MATATKNASEVLDWTALGDTATDEPSAETAAQTKSTELMVDIVITVAHMDANDAAANYVTVNVLKKVGTNGEDWRLHTSFRSGGGQATAEALDAESASGQKQVKVAATTDWDTGLGERLILYNVGTPVNSEIVEIDGWSDADYYIANDNLTNTHDAGDGDALYDGLSEHNVSLSMDIGTYKVTFHNADAAANYVVRVDELEVTTIS